MYVIPLPGDSITTDDDHTFIVQSFTNFKPEGPAVYVQTDDKVNFFYFSSIKKINGVHVKYSVRDGKVFVTSGVFKRKGKPGDYTLPQKNDIIFAHINGEVQKLKVVKYNIMHKAGDYAKGLRIIGLLQSEEVDEDAEPVIILLSQLVDVQAAIGHRAFNRAAFSKLYHEYYPLKGKNV
jgi:hypothetical protein